MEATTALESIPSEKDSFLRSANGDSCDLAQTETLEDTILGCSCTNATSDGFLGDASMINNCSPEAGLSSNQGVARDIMVDQNLFNACHDLAYAEAQCRTELEGSPMKKKRKKKHRKMIKTTCNGFKGDASSRENCSTSKGFGHEQGVSSNCIMDQHLLELNKGCDSSVAEAQVNVNSAQVETERKKKRQKGIQDISDVILGDASLTVEHLSHELGTGRNTMTETKGKMKRKKRIGNTLNCIKSISTKEGCIIDQHLFKLNSCDSSRTEAEAYTGLSQAETKSKKKRQKKMRDESNCIPGDASSMKNISTEEGLGHELGTDGNMMTDKHHLELVDDCCLAHIVDQANKELECSQMAAGESEKLQMRMQNHPRDKVDALSLEQSSAQEYLDHELGDGTNEMAYQHHPELNSSGTRQSSTVYETPTCSLENSSLMIKHDFNGNCGLVLTGSESLEMCKTNEKLILHCSISHDLVDNIVDPVMATEKASAEPSTELQLNSPSCGESEGLLIGPYFSNVEAEKNLFAEKINCDRSHNDLAPVGSKQIMEIKNEVNISQALRRTPVKAPNDFVEDASTLRCSSAGECLGHEPGVTEITMADQRLLGMDCSMIGQSTLVSEDQSCSCISTSLDSNHTCDGNSSFVLIDNKTMDVYNRKDKSRESPDLADRSAEDTVGTQKILPETSSDGKACELLESKSERSVDEGCTAQIEIQETILAEKLEYGCTESESASKESKEEVEMDNNVNDIKTEIVSQVSPISVSRSLAACPRKKLLILDINGLLADIVSSFPRGYQPDLVLPEKSVFKRPYCSYFLQFCFEKFNVGVWSSRAKKNMDRIVYYLFNKSIHKLLFCWDQSHCTKTGFTTVENADKPLVLKELKKLWENEDDRLPWKRGEYNESNTLLLDDSPYKALRNPVHTAVFPYPYRYRNYTDSSLGPRGALRLYLEKLANAENVQEFVSQNPFGQRAITEANPSWGFYRKIIGPNSS